jgi:hypothetical protein
LTWSNRLDRRLSEVEAALEWYKLSCLDRHISGWLVYAMALTEAMPDQAVHEMLERFPFTEAERLGIGQATPISVSDDVSRRETRLDREIPAGAWIQTGSTLSHDSRASDYGKVGWRRED